MLENFIIIRRRTKLTVEKLMCDESVAEKLFSFNTINVRLVFIRNEFHSLLLLTDYVTKYRSAVQMKHEMRSQTLSGGYLFEMDHFKGDEKQSEDIFGKKEEKIK